MINPEQVDYLLSLCDNPKHIYDDNMKVVSVFYPKKNRVIRVNYENFKKNMGLEDIPLHWATSYNTFIAGGAAMNWVWQEKTNEDIDFFFANEGAWKRFCSFIKSYGFESEGSHSHSSSGGPEPFEKLVNPDENMVLNLIGGTWTIPDGYGSIRLDPYGDPINSIKRFDIRVCQFAIDCENIYMSLFGILDLLTMRLVRNPEVKRKEGKFERRLRKYKEKGFGESTASKTSAPTDFMKGVLVKNKYFGRVLGKLENSDFHIVNITNVPFLASKPHKQFGIPLRQNKLEWGAFHGNETEIAARI